MDILNILVTGVFWAGKTTFISQISETELRSVEREGADYSVAFNVGRLTIDAATLIYFWGMPEAMRLDVKRYESIFDPPARRGVILVVNAVAKPEELKALKDGYLASIRTMNIPYVIALNRYDVEGALTEQQVRESLEINSSEVMVKYDSTSHVQIRNVVLTLIKQMPEDNVVERVRAKLMKL